MRSKRLTHKERHKSNFLKTRAIAIVPVREPVLIVCEDSKSSVFYFQEKRAALRLEATQVKVTGKSGSHPSSVVEFAKNERNKNRAECKKSGQVPYKHVYCVFDVDEHPNFAHAIQRVRDLGFISIVSNQSFELWYLLHYIDGAPGWKHRDQLNSELSVWMKKEYSKSARGMYDLLKDREPRAIKLSEQLLKLAKEDSKERDPYRNPSTEVHLLVQKLNELSGR